MPQDPQTPGTPGEDVLLDTLQRSRLHDDQRQQIWDAYHTQGKEEDFIGSMNKLSVNDDVKQTLYDMRYKGFKNMPSNTQASAIANLDTQTQAKGDVRPSTRDALRKATGISPRSEGLFERMGNVVAPFMQHVRKGGAAPDERLLAPEAMMTPMQQGQHPMLRAAGEFAGSLTSGGNIALVAGTAGLGGAAPALSKALGFAFSAQMLKGAYDQYAPLRDAWNRGDEEGVKYHLTHMLLSGALGVHGVTEGMVDDPGERFKVKKELKEEARVGASQVLNARMRENLSKPDTSTPMGPVSTDPEPLAHGKQPKGQQMHLDFTAKAPTEAHAPTETSGASKVADAPPVDRAEALIAPKPEDYVGKEAPLPRYMFPGGLADTTLETGRVPGVPGFEPRAPRPVEVEKPAAAPAVTELPVEVRKSFDTIAELGRQADLAENDSRAAALHKQRGDIEDVAMQIVEHQTATMSPEQRGTFIENLKDEATRLEAQAKAANDLTDAHVKNQGVKKEIAEVMEEGGPARERVVGEKGERGVAKFTSAGPDVRFVLQKAVGDVPRYEYTVKSMPEGTNPDEWLQGLTYAMSRREEIIQNLTDAVTEAQEGHRSLNADERVEEWDRELKQIANTYGEHVNIDPTKVQVLKSGETRAIGRRPKEPVQVGEHGEIQAPEQVKSWTKARADRFFGKNLRAIPPMEDFYRQADVLSEKARLLRSTADKVAGPGVSPAPPVREGERGAVGVRGQVKQVSLTPTPEDMLSRAKRYGLAPRKVTAETPSGNYGFLIVDSKGDTHWLDAGGRTHEEVASRIYPTGLTQMMRIKGVVRKAAPVAYEFHHLDNRQVQAAIDLDVIKDRMTNQPVRIDTKDSRGRAQTLQVEPGYNNLSEGIDRAKRKTLWGREMEAGFTPGAVSLASGVTGAAAGGAMGFGAGGPIGGGIGAAAGFTVGFLAPEILRAPRVQLAMQTMRGVLDRAGIRPREWFNGTPQIAETDPTLLKIQQEQNMHSNRGTSATWAEKLRQIPPRIARGIDPFVYLADKQNMGHIARFLMSFDRDGQVWHNLHLDDDRKGLYLAARDATGKAYGLRADQQMAYAPIKADAEKAGLSGKLTSWLNLKGYQRTFDVLQEHTQELEKAMSDTQDALRNPNTTVRETVALQDKLRQLERFHKEIQDRVASGQAVPGGYTPESLRTKMDSFQNELGVNNATRLNDLTNRVFKSRERILDMLHSNGLIFKDSYDLYKRRGPEYVPMERIMDDLEDSGFHSAVRPLDLKHQTVIKMLEGSSRTNVNPWEAFSHADARAFSQIIRNDTMKHALDMAQAFPESVGKEFKSVSTDYRAKAGEGILGHYVDGKPELYAVPKYLSDTLSTYPGATKTALGVLAHMWKTGATVANLSFQIGSPIAHALSGLALSEANSKDVGRFVTNWVRSAKSVISRDETYRELVRSGAAFGGFQAMLDPESVINPSDVGFTKSVLTGHGVEKLSQYAAALENVNRVNTFRNARLEGHSIEAAAYEAKYRGGSPDFSRMGDFSRPLNNLFMFANARAQYMAQMAEALRKDPKRIGGVIVAMTAATIALQTYNSQLKDSQGNSLLAKVPTYERERSWPILLPITHIVRGTEQAYRFNVPKFYLGQVLNPLETAVQQIAKAEDRAGTKQGTGLIGDMVHNLAQSDVRTGTQQMLDAAGNLSPIPLRLDENRLGSSLATSLVGGLNPAIKTAMEQYANRGDLGSPIIPPSQQNIDPRFQYGPNTSPAAVAIGSGGLKGAATGGALGGAIGLMYGGIPGAAGGFTAGAAIGSAGISPRRLEAGARSLFAGTATQTESYLNPFVEGANTPKKGPLEIAQSAPLVGGVMSRFLGGQGDQKLISLSQQFYSLAQDTAQPLQTFEELKKTDPQKAAAYGEQNKNAIAMGRLAEAGQQRMGQLGGYEKAVLGNPQMTDKEKQAKLMKIHDYKIFVLEKFTEALRRAPQGTGRTSPLGPGGVR